MKFVTLGDLRTESSSLPQTVEFLKSWNLLMLLDFLGLELWLVLRSFLLELLCSKNLAGFGGLISWANDYCTSYIC